MDIQTSARIAAIFVATAVATLRASAGAVRVYDADDYVQNGLVAHFDGIRNVGAAAAHDPDATTWANLGSTGSANDATRIALATGPSGAAAGCWTNGNAYAFKGLEYFALGGTLNLGNAVTLQAATKYSPAAYTDPTSTHYPSIFGGTSANADNFSVWHDKGKLSWLSFKVLGTTKKNTSTWDGLALNAVYDGANTRQSITKDASYTWQNGETDKRIDSANTTYAIGTSQNGTYNMRQRMFFGEIQNIRLYDRVLSEAELAWNQAVDDQRFREAPAPSLDDVNAILRSDISLDGSLTNDWIGRYIVGGSHEFTAPAAFYNETDGLFYEPTGHAVETWDAATGGWGAAVTNAGASYAATDSDKVRVTWLWRSQNSIECSIEADAYAALLGTASTFAATARGGSGSYLYRWDFGDGSAAQTTTTGAVAHVYGAGLHRASVSVSDDGGATWGATAEAASAIVVAPAHLYVDAANATPAFPYDTPATAASSFADAYGCLTNTLEDTADMAVVDGATVHVAAGTYAGAGYVLAGAVTVEGAGPAATVFDGAGGYRVFSLLDAAGALRSLCVSNAAFTETGLSGAGVYMTAGLVEDCAIASCGDFSTTNKPAGGGIYASGGRIRRTVFTDCKVHTRWSAYIGYGSALYLSGGAVCENSLFTGNAPVLCLDHDSTHRRGGVVYLTGAGTALVNCSVVRNRLSYGNGFSDGRFAGIVQRYSAKVVNCVAYGNEPDDEYATGHGDVFASGDNSGKNWENYFVNSAWGTAIRETPSPVAVDETAFRNYAGGSFAPKTTSVLVDAGTDWAGYLAAGGLSETDLEGNPRRNGRVLDIGCYEFVDRPTVLVVK